MTEISIIIPTHNEEEYLAGALESIKKQTFKDYEIIVSDSGSTDKTVEIAQKYGAIVVSGPKKGPGPGQNIGAKIAKGDILFFMDADTTLESESILGLIKEKISSFKYIGGCFRFEGKGKLMYRLLWKAFDLSSFVSSLIQRPLIPGFDFFIDKKVFDESGGYDEQIGICEDTDLSLKVSKKGKLIYVKEGKVVNSLRRFEKKGLWKTLKFYAKGWYYIYLNRKAAAGKLKFEPVDEM